MANLVTGVNATMVEQPKGFNNYMRAEEEFQTRKALAMQDAILKKQAMDLQRQKVNEFDIGKVGEQAFIKASQGLPLDPTEASALQYLDAKSPTAVFNPVTGVMEQKPSLLQRAGIGSALKPQASPQQQYTPQQNAQVLDVFEPQDEWGAKYQAQLDAAAGNPKLQQSIRQEMAKARTTMTEAEAKAAGFAERMGQSEPSIEANKEAAMSLQQKALAATPVFGNKLVSPEYQQFDQAQRDFINAQLRRESGAVISEEEFDNARKQYFPQYGDSPEVLAQKKANRDAAINSMITSAGAAYTPAEPVVLKAQPPQGAKPYGTSGGKTVYKLPNGKFIMEQ